MNWRIDRLLYRKDKSLAERMLLFPLYLLSFPYGWGVRTRTFLYSTGLLRQRRLPCPVISVGNITVGGTGKTPLVMALAKGLMERGIPVAVLSRGYRGKRTSGSLVSNGKDIFLSPEESGDEPFLMAQVLKGVPILMGKDRFKNGQMALQQFQVRGFLLDDGFQHLPLHRDLNIVLIDSQIGFGDGHLLPRGILREPLSHLRRAHLFVLTKVKDPEGSSPLEAGLREIQPSTGIFHSHYEPTGLIGPGGEKEGLHPMRGKRVLALSGIAHPDHFSALIKQCGMEVMRERIFPDHHLYTSRDINSIRKEAREVDWVVTTEKDMVKLMRFPLGSIPLRALRIESKIREEERFYQRVMEIF